MYKCKECGTEYDIKPEYCDCGNDTFEEVNQTQTEQTPIVKQEIPTPPKKNTEYNIPKQDFHPQPQTREKTVQYDYSKIKSFFDPVSTILFLCCIAAAIYVTTIGYDFSKPLKKAEQPQIEEAQVPQNIPEVDSFWDSTPAKKTETSSAPAPQESKIMQYMEQVLKPQSQTVQQSPQPKPQVKPQNNQPSSSSTSKPVQSTSKSAQVNKSSSQSANTTAQKTATKQAVAAKPSQTQKTSQTTSSAQNSAQKTASNQQTSSKSSQTSTKNSQGIDLTSIVNNNKNYSNNQNSGTSTSTSVKTQTSGSSSQTVKPAATSASSTKTQSTQTTSTQTQKTQTQASASNTQTSKSQTTSTAATTTPEVKQVDPAVLKQELANYKIGLRNTIGKKIDFTRVVGDGECSLSFSLDSSGRLLNRKFTKQSTNVTLNDAVYAAVNSMTRYNPPPAGYKNETLNLNIRFYNGNFSISLN